MKLIVTCFCLSLCAAGRLYGQSWSLVNDYTPEVLWDVAFASASVGVVVGQQGQVYRTVDGGANWSFYDLGTTEILKTVYFADVNRGFILGGTMYKTTNSGASWGVSAGLDLPMEGIYFVDNQRGTVVGSSGRIFHTSDGGSNWTAQASNTSNTLKSIWFTSQSNGIIVGEAGVILQTTDGGATWDRYLSGTLQDLNSIFFLNATMGFICGGNGTILRTLNGGLTWLPAVVESTTVSLLKVKMLDLANGFAFGNSSTFARPVDFFRTTDGGVTWKRQDYGKNRAVQFYGMAAIDPKRCVVVGSLGTVMRTIDGGMTWQSQELLPEPDLVGVTAPFTGILTRSCVAAGSTGYTFESSTGATWGTNRYTTRRLRAIGGAGVSLSAHTSIMVGDGGTVVVSHVNQNAGSHTTVRLNNDRTLRSVFMVDRDTAYIAADSGYIFKTTNRGASWTSVYSGAPIELNGIFFPDPMNGFAVGEAGWIRRTTDFGQSWVGLARISPARLNAITFPSPNVGIIVGELGIVLRTSNGGISWVARASPVAAELHSVVFADAIRGIAVGDSGRIIGTNDGGLTWQIQPSPVKTALRGITFLNDTVAVAVGDKRTIVRSSPGVTSSAEMVPGGLPSTYVLEQNYPNPFNPKTGVRFQVPALSGVEGSGVSDVKLTVYDLLGREVAVLVNERKAPGSYEVSFDGSGLASGVYIYRLTARPTDGGQAGTFMQSRTMLFLK